MTKKDKGISVNLISRQKLEELSSDEKLNFILFRETDLYGLKFRMYLKNVS